MTDVGHVTSSKTQATAADYTDHGRRIQALVSKNIVHCACAGNEGGSYFSREFQMLGCWNDLVPGCPLGFPSIGVLGAVADRSTEIEAKK